jgi:hypothetical protein
MDKVITVSARRTYLRSFTVALQLWFGAPIGCAATLGMAAFMAFFALVVGLPFLLYSTATYAPPREGDLALISGIVQEVTTSCLGRSRCQPTGVVVDTGGKRFDLGSDLCYLARDKMAPGDHVLAQYIAEGSQKPVGTAFGIRRGPEVLCRYVDAVAARKRRKDVGVDFGVIAAAFGLIAIALSFFLGKKLGYARQAAGRAIG